MENRLKFLYHSSSSERRSDTRRKARVRLEEHVQAGREPGRQIPLVETRDVMGSHWRQRRRGRDSIVEKSF
jgi:hypothetical protein